MKPWLKNLEVAENNNNNNNNNNNKNVNAVTRMTDTKQSAVT